MPTKSSNSWARWRIAASSSRAALWRNTAPKTPWWVRTWRPTMTFSSAVIAKQTDVLEGAGDAGLGHHMRRGWRIRLAGQLEGAGVRLVQAGDDVEEGGLAGAVRPDQAVDLAFHDLDADVGQRLQAAEALVDAGDIQYDLFAHDFLRQPSRQTTLRVYRCRRRAGPRAWARATGRPDGSA